MCTEKLINWLFRPSHLSTLSVTQRTIIQVSPHLAKTDTRKQISVSPLINISWFMVKLQ